MVKVERTNAGIFVERVSVPWVKQRGTSVMVLIVDDLGKHYALAFDVRSR